MLEGCWLFPLIHLRFLLWFDTITIYYQHTLALSPFILLFLWLLINFEFFIYVNIFQEELFQLRKKLKMKGIGAVSTYLWVLFNQINEDQMDILTLSWKKKKTIKCLRWIFLLYPIVLNQHRLNNGVHGEHFQRHTTYWRRYYASSIRWNNLKRNTQRLKPKPHAFQFIPPGVLSES